jgi:hypothetical protein
MMLTDARVSTPAKVSVSGLRGSKTARGTCSVLASLCAYDAHRDTVGPNSWRQPSAS